MPVSSVSPPEGAASKVVITSICAPPAPVTGSMFTVESIDIAALDSPGLVTLIVVGTAVPPAGLSGKNAVFFTLIDLRRCVSASKVPHHIIGTSTYAQAKSASLGVLGGNPDVGPVVTLLVNVIVSTLLLITHGLDKLSPTVTFILSLAVNALSSVVVIFKVALLLFIVTVPVSEGDDTFGEPLPPIV